MDETLHIQRHKRNDERTSNYRLLGAPAKLTTKLYQGYVRPDGDGWAEVDAVCSIPTTVVIDEKFGQKMRIRGSRKQRAARAAVPRESIKVVQVNQPAPAEVGIARYEGKTEQEIKIAELEAKVRELMGVAEKLKAIKKRKEETTAALVEKLNANRLK